MKENKFKVGDKAKCIEGFYDSLIVGEKYTITKVSGQYVYVDGSEIASWYAYRFELAEDSFEDKLIKAYKLIDQNVYWQSSSMDVLRFDVAYIRVENSSIKLVNENDSWIYYERVIEKPADITVRLNNKYDAIVSKDSIVVGCQTFPISIIDDLVKAKNEFGKFQ